MALVECGACGGSGKVTHNTDCSACNGTGSNEKGTNAEGHPIIGICERCGGSGKGDDEDVECQTCGGDGHWDDGT